MCPADIPVLFRENRTFSYRLQCCYLYFILNLTSLCYLQTSNWNFVAFFVVVIQLAMAASIALDFRLLWFHIGMVVKVGK